jgi:hypothetical protein
MGYEEDDDYEVATSRPTTIDSGFILVRLPDSSMLF